MNLSKKDYVYRLGEAVHNVLQTKTNGDGTISANTPAWGELIEAFDNWITNASIPPPVSHITFLDDVRRSR